MNDSPAIADYVLYNACIINTLPREGVQSIVMSMSIFSRVTRKWHGWTSPIFCAVVACGCGSVLFWRRCNYAVYLRFYRWQ